MKYHMVIYINKNSLCDVGGGWEWVLIFCLGQAEQLNETLYEHYDEYPDEHMWIFISNCRQIRLS